MHTILISIFAVTGYMAAIGAAKRRMEMTGQAAAVASAIYICLIAAALLAFSIVGGKNMALFAALIAAVAASAVAGARFCMENHGCIHKGMAALYAIYCVAVAYITIISREPKAGRKIQAELLAQEGDGIRHAMLNAAMFIPVGFLFASILPEKLGRLKNAVLNGLAVSAMIESAQLLFQLGNCDITDIAANMAGAAIGWLAASITLRNTPKEAQKSAKERGIRD